MFKQTNKKQYNEIYSFDIFDTLITRTVAEPNGIFSLMDYIIKHDDKYSDIPELLINNFYTIRVEAEQFVRKNISKVFNKNEIIIFDIYNFIQSNYALSKEQKEKLLQCEIQTEKNNLRPIRENISILKSLISEHKTVILISDMYMPEYILRDFLTSIDSIFSSIEIFVSCEHNCSKFDGKLYECIREKLNLNDYNWHHIGDNKHSDLKNAGKYSIKSELYNHENLLEYEKYALLKAGHNPKVSLLTGIAKYTRICSTDKTDAYKLGCSYTAPILYGYVKWLIAEAVRNNVNTLHFIARDGYLLKEIADVIIENKNLDIKTRYIYGSRKAWRIPDVNNIDRFVSWIFSEYTSELSLNFIAEKLNIPLETFLKYTGDIQSNKKLKGKAKRHIEKLLLDNHSLKSEIIRINEKKKNLLIDYLKQELDLSDNKVVFVDLNGSGRTQDIISQIIKENIKDIEVISYYFHFEFNMQNSSKSLKRSYFSSEKYRTVLMEMLCRAAQGQTIGYERKNNIINVLTENVNIELFEQWGYSSYLNGIIDFIKNILDYEKRNFIQIDSLTLYLFYVTYLKFGYIDKNMAELLGTIPYSQMKSEEQVNECAPKLSFKDLMIYLMFGKINTEFVFISAVRSGKLAKIIMKFNEHYGSLRKFLLNVYINKSSRIGYIRILGIKISLSSFLERVSNVR